jgi:hypothetical protein
MCPVEQAMPGVATLPNPAKLRSALSANRIVRLVCTGEQSAVLANRRRDEFRYLSTGACDCAPPCTCVRVTRRGGC